MTIKTSKRNVVAGIMFVAWATAMVFSAGQASANPHSSDHTSDISWYDSNDPVPYVSHDAESMMGHSMSKMEKHSGGNWMAMKMAGGMSASDAKNTMAENQSKTNSNAQHMSSSHDNNWVEDDELSYLYE